MGSDSGVKRVVRERYAERAKKTSGSGTEEMCCGPSSIYNPVELKGLPSTVLAASAGCGNPIALADVQEGEVVLDLGSGGGIDCFLAGRSVGQAGRVLGVDMTPDMARLAKSNARKLRASNVEFILAELETLPLEDNTVDVVISNCVINLSPDKDSVFQEAYRVLRPGGRLHVSDILLEQELPESIKRDPENWASCIAGADLKYVYLERMRRAGFAEVAIKEASPVHAGEMDRIGILNAKVQAKKLSS